MIPLTDVWRDFSSVVWSVVLVPRVLAYVQELGLLGLAPDVLVGYRN